jgi:deoxycytidylate deaminase
MSRKRYVILAKCYDKRKRLMSVGENSYSKTSTVMSYFAEKVGTPCKVFLHAEVQALLRTKDKKPYRLTIERYDNEGNFALAKPCPVCSEAIKAWGISVVEYTSPTGWVREVLN